MAIQHFHRLKSLLFLLGLDKFIYLWTKFAFFSKWFNLGQNSSAIFYRQEKNYNLQQNSIQIRLQNTLSICCVCEKCATLPFRADWPGLHCFSLTFYFILFTNFDYCPFICSLYIFFSLNIIIFIFFFIFKYYSNNLQRFCDSFNNDWMIQISELSWINGCQCGLICVFVCLCFISSLIVVYFSCCCCYCVSFAKLIMTERQWLCMLVFFFSVINEFKINIFIYIIFCF